MLTSWQERGGRERGGRGEGERENRKWKRVVKLHFNGEELFVLYIYNSKIIWKKKGYDVSAHDNNKIRAVKSQRLDNTK